MVDHIVQLIREASVLFYSQDMRGAFDKLKEALDKAGISQAELARRLGVTRGAVNNWVRGKGTPSLGHLQETARILNMTITEILGEEILFAETKDERDAIELLRAMTDSDRDHFLRLMRLSADQQAVEETAVSP